MSLCKSELGTSIHGLLYFWGRSIQEMGGDVVIGGCCNRWVVILRFNGIVVVDLVAYNDMNAINHC